MSDKTPSPPKTPYEITVLDELISTAYDSLTQEMKEHPKLGDLLKMIELRRKLLPNEEDQRQFWAMLEGIRRKNLAGKESGSDKKSTTKGKSNRRPKAGNSE